MRNVNGRSDVSEAVCIIRGFNHEKFLNLGRIFQPYWSDEHVDYTADFNGLLTKNDFVCITKESENDAVFMAPRRHLYILQRTDRIVAYSLSCAILMKRSYG
jgi:hypothetical protein